MHTGFWEGEPQRNMPLGRPRRRHDNSKMELKYAKRGTSGFGEGQIAGRCKYGNEKLGSIRCITFLE